VVHKDQEVEIKIEAFTFTSYGLLHGTVVNVSQDTIATEDVNTPDVRNTKGDGSDQLRNDDDRQARRPSYIAHVSIQEGGIETEKGFMPLEPGMAVTAEIKTRQRRVISYLLSPLLRYRQEGFRER